MTVKTIGNVKNIEKRFPTNTEDDIVVVSGIDSHKALAINCEPDGGFFLTVSTSNEDSFLSSDVKAMRVNPESMEQLVQELNRMIGIKAAPEPKKHISSDECKSLIEGDQVRIREDLEAYERYGGVTLNESMSGSRGRVLTVQGEATRRSVRLSPDGFYFSREMISEVVAKAARHISQEEFEGIEVGDKIVIRTDLDEDKTYGGEWVARSMVRWAVEGQELEVTDVQPIRERVKGHSSKDDDWYNYSKEMIIKVIKAPKEDLYISEEEYQNIKEGDRIIIRKDIEVGSQDDWSTAFTHTMQRWSQEDVVLTVAGRDHNSVIAKHPDGNWFYYSRPMIAKVIKVAKYISQEEYDEIKEGDTIILRKDLTIIEDSLSIPVNYEMIRWAEQEIPLKVIHYGAKGNTSIRGYNQAAHDWYAFTREMIAKVIPSDPEKPDSLISDEDFKGIQVGDKVILREDLSDDHDPKHLGVVTKMIDFAECQVAVKVTAINSNRGSIKVAGIGLFEKFIGKEMIGEIIKKPSEHFRVAFSHQLWYAGAGGKITSKKDQAAIMNKAHANNVAKKYHGTLLKVDYSELEEN